MFLDKKSVLTRVVCLKVLFILGLIYRIYHSRNRARVEKNSSYASVHYNACDLEKLG